VPVILDKWNEPEPDVSVAVGTINDYLTSHPRRSDVRLLVEVSDTTLGFDRGRRCTAYARGQMPDYWVLNLLEEHLEVYRSPWRSRYRSLTVHIPGQELSPLAFPDLVLRVSDLILSVAARDKN
jgi:Uma2 family endonuclease